MNKELKLELDKIFSESLQPPYNGGLKEWVEENVVLPPAYSIPGKVNLDISPHLLKPAEALLNPKIMQVNLCMSTQVGKSFLSELFLPYVIVNAPGPTMRIFHNQEVSAMFTETRLTPLLRNCNPIKPLLNYNRFSTNKTSIKLPHMSIICGSSNTSLQHGLSIKYLLCDELHQWEPGQFNKFLARTTAFASRRKVVCASQPCRTGHEWEQICYKGVVYEWSWCCPKCSHRQLFHWSKEKSDGKYAGMNWDTVLNPDGETTNIIESSKTGWLECEKCDHKVNDTPTERRLLNDTGEYICTKSDGDASIVTYMAPCWVNPNLSFESKIAEYMIAKRTKKMTGLDELMEIFVTQGLGKFYHREQQIELSKMMVELYEKTVTTDWVTVLAVDVQRTGKVKYYVVRAFNKNGNESKRLEFGICRTFDEIEAIRVKYNIPFPLVIVDSGDGETTQEVYQECIRHGKVLKLNNGTLKYVCWSASKGDGQKSSYKHPDGISRLYAPPSLQDAGFPQDSKYKGIPLELTLFSNYSVKTILANLRDGLVPGVKWLIDHTDEEYDKQLYSESLVDVIDKKSGMNTKRWIQVGQDNHYLDVEVMCLVQAMRANVFSATATNESEMKKIIENSNPKKD